MTESEKGVEAKRITTIGLSWACGRAKRWRVQGQAEFAAELLYA